MITVEKSRLRDLTTKILTELGIAEEEAKVGSDVLVTADIRGVDSHGVARLPMYHRRIKKGLVNLSPKLDIVVDSNSSLVVDLDNGLGICTAPKVMEICIDRAKEFGISIATIRNSNHFGIAGYYSLMAAQKNMISIIGSNTSPIMAPFGGSERLLGTNPISIGVPHLDFPIVLDMATSLVSLGKLQIAIGKNEKVPLGWLVDKEGKPTDEPQKIFEGGSLLPLAGPKGYGLAVMIDMLSAILSGAKVGHEIGNLAIDDKAEGIGHFMIVIDISKFMTVQNFMISVKAYVDMMKNSKPAEGVEEIFLPGEIEARNTKDRINKGIPLNDSVVKNLTALCADIGFTDPESCIEKLLFKN